MIKKRELVTCILLSVITCGIYSWVWFAGIVDDTKTTSGDDSLPSGGTAVLLSIITCGIYMFYLYYKLGKAIQVAKQKKNLPSSDNSVLYLVLSLFSLSLVSECLIQNELNEMVTSTYTQQ